MTNMSVAEGVSLPPKKIAELVAPVARRYGMSEVYLFGSAARGELREDSDIDLVYSLGGTPRDYRTVERINENLERSLGRPVDAFSSDISNRDIRPARDGKAAETHHKPHRARDDRPPARQHAANSMNFPFSAGQPGGHRHRGCRMDDLKRDKWQHGLYTRITGSRPSNA